LRCDSSWPLSPCRASLAIAMPTQSLDRRFTQSVVTGTASSAMFDSRSVQARAAGLPPAPFRTPPQGDCRRTRPFEVRVAHRTPFDGAGSSAVQRIAQKRSGL
jgi:hypothetical protein